MMDRTSTQFCKKRLPLVIGGTLLLLATPCFAQEENETNAEEARLHYELMLEEAERARMEAETAREEALRASEAVREAARVQRTHRLELEEQDEMARIQDELSRAHRELREATREIARAHRDIARENQQVRVEYINLGDRPVIGVLLGDSTEDGVTLIGVSPDGPAERAGLLQGDVLTVIGDRDLAGQGPKHRDLISEAMAEVDEGDDLPITIIRGEEVIDLTIKPERREPGAWQSVISLPEVASAPSTVTIERIVVPEIDVEALNEQVQEITRRVQANSYVFIGEDGKSHQYRFDSDSNFEFDFPEEELSEMGLHFSGDSNVWFGFPQAMGLELTAINEGLGAYFKTERGVLVLNAREDNAYGLQAGDVVLEIADRLVNEPSDLMRAIREIEPGSELKIEIKRDRRNKTLTVEMPDRRFGFFHGDTRVEP